MVSQQQCRRQWEIYRYLKVSAANECPFYLTNWEGATPHIFSERIAAKVEEVLHQTTPFPLRICKPPTMRRIADWLVASNFHHLMRILVP
jgi:hypothetical protein